MDSSVVSVFTSDDLDASATQVRFSLATISICETIIEIVPAVVCGGFTGYFPA